jgi:hypothetical protein
MFAGPRHVRAGVRLQQVWLLLVTPPARDSLAMDGTKKWQKNKLKEIRVKIIKIRVKIFNAANRIKKP